MHQNLPFFWNPPETRFSELLYLMNKLKLPFFICYSLSRLNLVNVHYLVNQKGLTATFTKSSLRWTSFCVQNLPCKVISIWISTSGSRSTAIIPIAGIRLAIPIVGIGIYDQICKTFSTANGINLWKRGKSTTRRSKKWWIWVVF